jgi:hypothetical protein
LGQQADPVRQRAASGSQGAFLRKGAIMMKTNKNLGQLLGQWGQTTGVYVALMASIGFILFIVVYSLL